MFKRYSHTMFYSLQLDNAVKWYCSKLGFEIDYHAPGAYASLHHKAVGRIALHATEAKTDVGTGPMPYFIADSLDEAIIHFKKENIEHSEPRREGESPRFMHFKDLDGNYIGIEEM